VLRWNNIFLGIIKFYLTYQSGQPFQIVLAFHSHFGYNGSMSTMNGSNMNTKELMLQLSELDKQIFEAAIIENNGRVKMVSNVSTLDNLEVDAIQNQKYIDRIISVNASIDFLSNGGRVTICKPVVSKRMKRLYGV